MTIPFRDTSGGKAIGGGALAPRTKRTNTTSQVDGWRRGGSSSNPPVSVDFLVLAGGGGGPGTGAQVGGGGGGGGAAPTGSTSFPLYNPYPFRNMGNRQFGGFGGGSTGGAGAGGSW